MFHGCWPLTLFFSVFCPPVLLPSGTLSDDGNTPDNITLSTRDTASVTQGLSASCSCKYFPCKGPWVTGGSGTAQHHTLSSHNPSLDCIGHRLWLLHPHLYPDPSSVVLVHLCHASLPPPLGEFTASQTSPVSELSTLLKTSSW